MEFTNELLSAIGAWQNGWGEEQARRERLAERLIEASRGLPSTFKTVSGPCYRKRFIHKGELVRILLENDRSEGVCSWTLDVRFAERFKGLFRREAVSGAIFRHLPQPEEIVLNISALWADEDFVQAAEKYRGGGGENATALFNFKDLQGEVVLNAPLRGSEIVGLTGKSSDFDDLCDAEGIPWEGREALFKKLTDSNIDVGQYKLVDEVAARRILDRTIQRIIDLVEEHKKAPKNDRF